MTRLFFLAAAPFLMAALWMDDQPSFKPGEAPVLAPPASAVPISGRESGLPGSERKNPMTPTPEAIALGKTLFDTNCAMCHGRTSAERGPVGRKLAPPPPGLGHDQLGSRSDSHIFNAITFGFGRMSPFRDKLTPGERWSLVNYLRTRK